MRLALAVVPRVYMLYMDLVFATSKVEFNNFLDLHDVIQKNDGCVAVLWHEEVFTVAYAYGKAAKLRGHTLASRGDAGSIITKMLKLCNFVVFRGGSSTKKSRRDTAVIGPMIHHMKVNRNVIYGLTVDGSQGPAYRMKSGGIRIAQECERPVVLVRTWYRRSWRLETWDRTAIPLPFNEIRYYLRGPYDVPEAARTPEGFEVFFRRIEDELIELARLSYLDLGQEPPANLLERAESEPVAIPDLSHVPDEELA